jgi:hypothetical protein
MLKLSAPRSRTIGIAVTPIHGMEQASWLKR